MKKPWYIWFSIFAFGILWNDTARRILYPPKEKYIDSNLKMNLWLSALGQLFLSVIIYLMIPMVPFLVAISLLSQHYATISVIINCIQIVVLYLLGVYVTNKHVFWRKKNLPPSSPKH